MFDEHLPPLLGESADPVAAGWHLRELAQASVNHASALTDEVASKAELLGKSDPAILGGLLRVIHTGLLHSFKESDQEAGESVKTQSLTTIEASIAEDTPNRHLLLHLLAMARNEASLSSLIDLLQSRPPQKWSDAAQTISPLMQHDDWSVQWVYPKLLDCMEHASLASPVLDLANYLFRENRTSEHPAHDRLPMLNVLLGEVGGRLSKFEENPRSFGDDVETVHAMLSEAVALAVSLCDTVGLIGDASSIAKLNQVVELKHRRVQCEAAGALARLDDDLGKKRLLELAKDPAARIRAIHYADELNFGDSVEDEYRTDAATAEAEMALWLSQPQQMGVPPTSLEMIESRRLLWPSFRDPVDVFLVRFEYNFGDRTYSNVGITGPVTFAMSADVANLSMDDIVSIYAGWHADHPEIFTVNSDAFNEVQTRVMGTLQQHLDRQGYESNKPELLGFFLDEQAGVFTAVRDAIQCVVVTDGLETIDQPIAGRLRPLSPGDLFNLYKGRKMLRTFNPTSQADDDLLADDRPSGDDSVKES